MESEQFSLCWNNFHNNLSSGFQALFKDEDLVDVTLAAEGRYIKAHKIVLSVCSPYFKELFRVNPCKHPIVILHEINYNALKNLLQFMYQGEVSVNQDEIPTFMKVAEILKIKGLTDNNNIKNSILDSSNGFSNVNNPVPPMHSNITPIPANEQPMPTIRPRPMKSLKKNYSEFSDAKLPSPVYIEPPLKQLKIDNEPVEPSLESLIPALPTLPIIPNLIQPKQEPLDPDDSYREHGGEIYLEPSAMTMESKYSEPREAKFSETRESKYGETSEQKYNIPKVPADTSSPGTLQCILGRRGLPRLIVDGHTFFKKSTYKNKCFWYCKTNRQYKCPAVCWTVNGRIVKWPESHTHAIMPEVIQPGEDTVVPIEMLRQVLIDAAR